MSAEAEQQQTGARAAADASKDVPADGNGAPVPQVVSAPGIDASSPIVRTEVIPAGVVGVGLAPAGGEVRSGKRGGAKFVTVGYVLAVAGFLVVCLVVPRIKSNVGGKALLVACVGVLAAGAGMVAFGFVRETVRRL